MSSSLKISLKLPKPPTEQPTKAPSHKATKRRITSDDEDSDSTVSSKGKTPFPKPPSKKPRLSYAEDVHPRLDSHSRSESSQPIAAKSRLITGVNKKLPKKQKRIVSDDEDVTSVPPVPPAPVPAPLSEAEPPKKKLPTIKKKSKTDSARSTFVSPAPAPPPKAVANPGKVASAGTAKPEPPVLPKKPAGPVQATTMNASGTGDFDLREPNIWASLIGKGTSNSGPRVGLEKRVSTEERQKQLDKMRDDARARREDQYRHTFDLQAQSQKIAAFERKCASHKTRFPGPNVLGAAFKVRPIRS